MRAGPAREPIEIMEYLASISYHNPVPWAPDHVVAASGVGPVALRHAHAAESDRRDLEALSESAVLAGMLSDYAVLREQARACR